MAKKARKAKAKKTKRKVKVRKVAKRKARGAKSRKKSGGGLFGAISEAAGLRRRLAGHDTFED
jgi:hypothetical protein